ncbi:hypothetical protein [Bacillus sp. NPDC093026]|uniref:hypothetical protein n=1 Tax=Bacillus sp. NPDC093026 TaxID=3363948 RepID=UPI0037FE6287
MTRHQLTFDARKEAQLCLVQAGGWITIYQGYPVFAFATAEDKETYRTLTATQFAIKERRRGPHLNETIEASSCTHKMFAQSE